jgi:peptide/nickel transport system substrate-binding protein
MTTERHLHHLLQQVRSGALPRRAFIQRMVAAGLTAPMASMLMMNAGIAQTQSPVPAYKPTRRGGGGAAARADVAGPHAAAAALRHRLVKDIEGCSLFYEPLARWDADGQLQPVLAAEIPSRDNGGVAADGAAWSGSSRRGVTWHDGAPFSADDVVFNWQFATDPATASTRAGPVPGPEDREDRLAHRARGVRQAPAVLGRQLLLGVPDPEAPVPALDGRQVARGAANHDKPVGTGPYRFVDLRPGDMLRGELNPATTSPTGRTSTPSRSRAAATPPRPRAPVMQTGEFDYAWNLLVEDEVLKRMETAARAAW